MKLPAMKFLVIHKGTRFRWDFDSPKKLALFMWGKDTAKYDVLTRITLPAELGMIERKLERLKALL
jgi:hypothetical protein